MDRKFTDAFSMNEAELMEFYNFNGNRASKTINIPWEYQPFQHRGLKVYHLAKSMKFN